MTSPSEEGSSETRPVPSIYENEILESQYRVLRTIGQGGYAKVQLAYHRLTGTPVAVKVLEKNKWSYSVRPEVDIMKMLNHPNIISLLQVIESEKRIYLVMELAEGQQLYQYILQSGHLQEDEARGIFRQILTGVSYCHELGIVHCDLKPDNIMVDGNGKVKIIDFGLGTQVKPGQWLKRLCGGAPSFLAPELFLGKLYNGPKIDIWAMGVILYVMVVGKFPFDAAITPKLRRQVVAGKYTVPLNLSEELKDLLRRLMTVNPEFRPTATKVMAHPWLREDLEASPNHCEEMVPSLPDPAIVEAMEYMGFQAQDIKDSLCQRKYDQTMASYCLLQRQALQEDGCTTRALPMNPGVTPFPSLEDPAAFPLELRRRSEPALGTLLRGSATYGHVPAYGQQAGQRGSRCPTGSALPLCRPLQRPSTPDKTHQRAKSAPCTYSRSSDNMEDLGSHGSSAESKPTHRQAPPTYRQAQPRGWKGWTRRIRSALMRLCCCFPSRKKPRRGQNRVFPQN